VSRNDLLAALADRILVLPASHPLRVAVDGVDAAGKTTLASELAQVIEARGRSAIRASLDGFHQPRALRYRRGPDAPEGYYADAFDYAALRNALLLPLGPGGSRVYRRAVFDYRTDLPLLAPEDVAPPDTVLLVDGVFLLRPEIADLWDYRIFVDVTFATALDRAEVRDLAHFGSVKSVRERYQRRYLPAQRLYLAKERPRERADAIYHNDDPAHPTLTFRKAL
jgi:uridine kinase